MESCDPNGCLMVNVTKLYLKPNGCVFEAFDRVYSGRIIKGQTVLVYHDLAAADEDWTLRKQVVTNIWIYQAGRRIPINEAPPVSWILIAGSCILKTTTLTSEGSYIYFQELSLAVINHAKIAPKPRHGASLLCGDTN